MQNKQASSSKLEEESQRSTLDREIRNMVLTLTNRLVQLSTTKRSSSHRLGGDDEESDQEEEGISVITLAGNNTGATMRADVKDKLDGRGTLAADDQEAQETPGAYANGNYQAVNNSIMMGGEYKARDPGIHIVVSDYGEDDGHDHKEDHGKQKKKKKNKKNKSSSETSTEEEEEGKGKESKKEKPLE